MKRNEFIKVGSYLGLGLIVSSSALLSGCVGAPLAAAEVETFLFDVLLEFGYGTTIAVTCMAITKDPELCQTLSDIFSIVAMGRIMSGKNGRIKWVFDKEKALITLSAKTLEDGLDIVKLATTIEGNSANCIKTDRPIKYNSGIGTYPLVSRVQLCDGETCYKPDELNPQIAIDEILVRGAGYQLTPDDTYYNYFNYSPWYNNVIKKTTSRQQAYDNLNDLEKDNYQYLLAMLTPHYTPPVTTQSATDSVANQVPATATDTVYINNQNQPYQSQTYVSQPPVNQVYQPPITAPPYMQNSSVMPVQQNRVRNTALVYPNKLQQDLNNQDYYHKNGTLKEDKLKRDLKRDDYNQQQNYNAIPPGRQQQKNTQNWQAVRPTWHQVSPPGYTPSGNQQNRNQPPPIKYSPPMRPSQPVKPSRRGTTATRKK